MKHSLFDRDIDLALALKRKSVFLLGPRSTGKSHLYKNVLKADRVYDLLDSKTLRRLTSHPELLNQEIQKPGELIIIDEVQKIPEILNEVHRCIEDHQARFLLTGSSARKLKRNHANLLGGRATWLELMPLTWQEISKLKKFDLVRYLNQGGIPRHYLCEPIEIEQELEDYASLYLKEEIKDEAVTRNLEGFSRFLEVMALHSGDELAFEAFASDCHVKTATFKNYIEVLKDTLLGFEVPAFTKTKKRKAITRSKFYLFDVGVTRHLSGSGIVTTKSPLFGKAFEHWIAIELRSWIQYRSKKSKLSYWRSTSQFEVDFILDEIAVEVKSTELVTERMLRGLHALLEEKIIKKAIVISREPRPRKVGSIEILPYTIFLERLWSNQL